MKQNKLFNTLRNDAQVLELNGDICQNTKIKQLYDEQHYLEFYNALHKKIKDLSNTRARKAYITKMQTVFSEHEIDGKGHIWETAFNNIFVIVLAMMISKTEMVEEINPYVGMLYGGMIISCVCINCVQKIILKNKKRDFFYSRLLSDLEDANDKLMDDKMQI